jgi:DNA-binding MarR family transcriptional regulator
MLVRDRVSTDTEYVPGPEHRQGGRRPYHAAMVTNAQDPVHGVRLVVSLYREFEQVARLGDLSMAQYRTLLYLLGGSRRAGELAAANAVTKPTVSAMINGLRQQGWVADADDETGDGRVTRVELTKAGRERLERFESELATRMEELLPGTDRMQVRQFFGDLQAAHRRTREARLGGVFGGER